MNTKMSAYETVELANRTTMGDVLNVAKAQAFELDIVRTQRDELLAACEAALAILDAKAERRDKWRGSDQRTYEQLSAAITRCKA